MTDSWEPQLSRAYEAASLDGAKACINLNALSEQEKFDLVLESLIQAYDSDPDSIKYKVAVWLDGVVES